MFVLAQLHLQPIGNVIMCRTTFGFVYVQCACINRTVCACVKKAVCACVDGTAACGYSQYRLICVDVIRDLRICNVN